jgi:hypothetical protein
MGTLTLKEPCRAVRILALCMLTVAAFGMPEIKGHGWMIGVGRWKWVDVWAWPLALEFHEVFKQRIVGLGIGPGQMKAFQTASNNAESRG